MQTLQLQSIVSCALENLKAREMVVLNVQGLTSVTDVMIICSGTSSRHVKSIAEQVVVKAKEQGITPLGVEGDSTGEWVLVDLCDVVVHVMLPQAREFYNLEKLWSPLLAAQA